MQKCWHEIVDVNSSYNLDLFTCRPTMPCARFGDGGGGRKNVCITLTFQKDTILYMSKHLWPICNFPIHTEL